ncbi:hypothetical protein IEQ34_025110 [Dendrobium chrysotoxum]|uniref:Uncharacterized protein n=1 Tax=Dendrobium chrysotoxum TaxID=161865 RepID=A0AAV7FJ51_DENCH|nr:hypothetical protein IEQ34_025110 [Dendrobium chrysotoxum]
MKDELSGADIKSLVTEAGLLALRERRMRVTKKDFTTARERVIDRKQGSEPAGLYFQSSVPVSKWEANANPSGIRSAAAQQHTSTTKSPITASAAENGASATSNQRRVSATPYASALGSKQAFAPTESDARIQSDRMTFLLVGLIGNTVLATTRSGAKFVGVLSATSTAEGTGNSSLGVVLSCAQQSCRMEVGLDVPVSLSKGDRNINAAFGTDTEISGKSLAGDATGGRTLQKWTGGADTELLLDDSSSATAKDGKSGGWDQFAVNEAKFGVKSNYDETMYTTKLDKSGAGFPREAA